MSRLFYNLGHFSADVSSWDTSSVTNMKQMFHVRSARALSPQPYSPPVNAACRPAPRSPAASRPAVCPPFGLAVRVRLQPAAELQHVQRHNHGGDVRRTLCTCPVAPSPELGHTRACRLRRRCPKPFHRAAHLAPHRMPSFRLGSARSTSR
eukprot:scaffold125415_cov48-Phaeocystis_antarctica.AAC.2